MFNTNQGSQFALAIFTDEPKAQQIRISMGRKGRWVGNVFIDQLKYQEVPLRVYHE